MKPERAFATALGLAVLLAAGAGCIPEGPLADARLRGAAQAQLPHVYEVLPPIHLEFPDPVKYTIPPLDFTVANAENRRPPITLAPAPSRGLPPPVYTTPPVFQATFVRPEPVRPVRVHESRRPDVHPLDAIASPIVVPPPRFEAPITPPRMPEIRRSSFEPRITAPPRFDRPPRFDPPPRPVYTPPPRFDRPPMPVFTPPPRFDRPPMPVFTPPPRFDPPPMPVFTPPPRFDPPPMPVFTPPPRFDPPPMPVFTPPPRFDFPRFR